MKMFAAHKVRPYPRREEFGAEYEGIQIVLWIRRSAEIHQKTLLLRHHG
jgi:hypothetical protein